MNKAQKPILSFTSHKARLPLIDEIFRAHVAVADELGMDVCFACQDDSVPYLTEYQKSLIDSGRVELLHVEKDHGSNTKWTLCRQAHPESVMVVVDDDWEFTSDSIRHLLKVHERFPEAVICRAFRQIPWIGELMPLYEVKPFNSFPKVTTPYIGMNFRKESVVEKMVALPIGTTFPEHVLGILYPPHFPNCSPDDIPTECRTDDDVFIGARIAAEDRQLIFAGTEDIAEDRNRDLPGSLWRNSHQVNGKRTYVALKSVQDQFSSKLSDIGLGKVFVMTCKKYPQRRQSIKAELERLGISYIEQYDDGSMYPSVNLVHRRLNRCHLSKMLALRQFMEAPSERVTIIEDDVRFLKNIAEISRAIRAIPSDFGACRFNWALSPDLRKEWIARAPRKVVEVEKAMSVSGNRWVRCPYASCDGCTVISREVAEIFLGELEDMFQRSAEGEIDNSDDRLCRICERLGKPMYVYKPLICIQVIQDNVEKGKSPIQKFLNPLSYPLPGIVRSAADYNFGVPSTQSNAMGQPSLDNDGFGYVRMSHSVRMSEVPQQNPTINTRSSVNVLPRIGSVKRGYSNW